mgnify:CR=1 FL=1
MTAYDPKNKPPFTKENMRFYSMQNINDRRVILNGRRIAGPLHKKLPNWVLAAELFDIVNGGDARVLCIESGLDPEAIG